jgi:hypothetical protein
MKITNLEKWVFFAGLIFILAATFNQSVDEAVSNRVGG